MASGSSSPETFSMAVLAGKVKTDTYLLLIAGIIMVITLWTSKKSTFCRLKTSLDLSRQDEGEERFGSSVAARSIVGFAPVGRQSICRCGPAKVIARSRSSVRSNSLQRVDSVRKRSASI